MAECMDYNEDPTDDTTLVKYNNPVLVIKNPEKPPDSGNNLKVFLFRTSIEIKHFLLFCL